VKVVAWPIKGKSGVLWTLVRANNPAKYVLMEYFASQEDAEQAAREHGFELDTSNS
jgi:hypothetical protein